VGKWFEDMIESYGLDGLVGSGDNNGNGNELMAFAIRLELPRKYLIDHLDSY
jgi:hypothetical protein